jgi:nucleoside phosphorylase
MSKNKILLLIAVAEELGDKALEQIGRRCDIALTGVGKLNAFEATFSALQKGEYDVVINLGTCGSSKHPAGSVLRPNTVAQGDIYIDSPFATEPVHLATGTAEQSICSSDNFIGVDTPPSQLRLLEPYDCFDMESYAIVRAIDFYSKQNNSAKPIIEMIKIVSDAGDETLEDWSTRLENLRATLCNALNDVLSLYE